MGNRKTRYSNNYIIIGLKVLLILFLMQFVFSAITGAIEYQKAGGEIVLLFKEDISKAELKDLIKSLDIDLDIGYHNGDYALLSIKRRSDFSRAIRQLQKKPEVHIAQGNSSIETLGFSNDPYGDTQWAIANPGYYPTLSSLDSNFKSAVMDIDMDVVEAWEQLEGKTTREVIVAIIDTGVDYKHPDLAENIWTNPKEIADDGIDNDNNGYIDDVHGWDFYNGDASVCHYQYSEKYQLYLADPKDNDNHGTHVAGIIGAIANNNEGIAGIASKIDIKLMPLKINGGADGTGRISDAIEAIKYATMMGADICNLSWGTSKNIPALEQVMKEADMLFIAAAGNAGTNNNQNPIYPANFRLDNLISVTFINSYGKLNKLSNYGNLTIDLAAPGEDVVSTTVGTYATMSGSSMAAPQVAGAAALLYSMDENLYPANIKEILINNLKLIPDLEGLIINPGIPNIQLAVQAATEQLKKDMDAPELSFETIYNKERMTIPIKVEDLGGSNIRVLRWIYGERSLEDFYRGTSGTRIEEDYIDVVKAGIYTFYASDYAGNETVKSYKVEEDVTAPKVSLSYTVANNFKTRTITARIKEMQSGIKRVKYMKGSKKAKDFLPEGAGTELQLKDGKVSFKVKKDGVYTVFAIDYRGNTTVKEIEVKTVEASDLKLSRTSKTMKVGDRYTLLAYLKPVDTTDMITFKSTNEEVATITKQGKIKAIKEGYTDIIVKTSSGLQRVCRINVK